MTKEGPASASFSSPGEVPVASTDVQQNVRPQDRFGGPPEKGPNQTDEDADPDADPVAFVLAGVTRTAVFVIKRVGMSPEVLRSFLQRKAFMKIASTHSSRIPSTGAAGIPGSSSGKLKVPLVARTYGMEHSPMDTSLLRQLEIAPAPLSHWLVP
jgi:hypothetical protein